ncbi:MAG TPA: 6-carboxytetrahydropterin synthase QueD [Ignavibacteriaceae bacterium]|jgi:6-pyruvoyltetrahydropterin/6-carboxytetrahydropterin synthase|nr:6-carboxytetrahydropterin synthase QueD [Ignavibacteriaceae bacterium]
MKIAKEFHWEMGHRLPEHFGKCKNIHGHSYRMIVEVEGSVNDRGMIMDYYDLKKVVNPIIEELDHAFMVYEQDKEIVKFLESVKSKRVIVGFQSTVENICKYILEKVKGSSLPSNVEKVKVRIFESVDDYAEEEAEV